MEKARAHILVEGRVQGVYFRAYARNVAHGLGLSGWVRNLHDGRVEAVFEGRTEVIEQAIAACREGPEGSSVRGIDVKWEPFAGEAGFEILY